MSHPSNIKKCKYCNCLPEIDEIPITDKDNLPFYKYRYIVYCENQKCIKTPSTKSYSSKNYAVNVWNKMMEK